MITNDFATAQIFFVLASDNQPQLQELKRDLERSNYRYFFASYSNKPTLVASVTQGIADNAGKLPTVMVINYRFAGKDCENLLELVRQTGKSSGIECVVTHPPKLESVRVKLEGLGARLFDGQRAIGIAELTLH